MSWAAPQPPLRFHILFSSRLKSERAKPRYLYPGFGAEVTNFKTKICSRGRAIAVPFLLPEQRCHVLACLALIRAAGAIETEVSATHSSRRCRCELLEVLITAQCASTGTSLPLCARPVCVFDACRESHRAMTGGITFKNHSTLELYKWDIFILFYQKKRAKTVASCWCFQRNGLQASANSCSAKLYS